MRRRLLPLVLLAAALLAPGTALAQDAPAPTPPPEPLLSGTLLGTDGRAVNALIGFDWKDAQGRTLHRTGCVQDRETCNFAGYGSSLRVNATLPATGTPDTATATTTFDVQPPAGAKRVFVEVYPQNERFRTDEARYGHAMRHGVDLPLLDALDLQLPLVLCGEGGRVGTLRGTASRDGAGLPLRRVVAWSLEAYDQLYRPVLGWNIGTAREDGTFVVPNLPADQRYQLWLTAVDGSVSRSFDVVPPSCGETVLAVNFPAPTAAPLPADPTPAAPLALPASPGAGQGVLVEGVVAQEGATVQLLGSTGGEPARLLRSGVSGVAGRWSFTLYPERTLTVQVRTGGGPETAPSEASPPTVVPVRSQVSARWTRLAPRTYRVEGTTRPARAQEVLLYQRLGNGTRRLLARGTSGEDGRYALTRRFLTTGALDLLVVTRAGAANAEGTSAVRRLTVS